MVKRCWKMSEKFIKSDLIKELLLISSSDFENICYEIFKEKYSGIEILHPGLNINDRSVKGTLDIENRNLEICLECSVQENYFTDPKFSKIENDINHIKNLSHGKVKKIYLYCSQIEPPLFGTKWTDSTVYKNNSVLNIEIFDAKKIAEQVFELSIEKGMFFDRFSQYLPEFKNNMDRATYFENIPKQNPNYICSDEIFDSLSNKVSSNSITVVSGISGAGKTELVIDFAIKKRKNFENVLWLYGDDYITNSTNTNFKRGDKTLNVEYIFNNTKTLLVIDNYNVIVSNDNFSSFNKGFLIGSKIIITSILSAIRDEYFMMPEYPENEALKLLGDFSDKARDLLHIINIPVVLTSIKSICAEQCSYEEIYSEIDSILPDLSNNKNERILTKILSKYTELGTLKKICNILNSQFDIKLLSRYIGVVKFNNIVRSSFLRMTNSGKTCTVHHFIIKCLKSSDESADYINYLSDYLNLNNGLMDENILRQIHISYKDIKDFNIRKQETLNWITYSLLQIENETTKKDIYRSLYKYTFESAFSIEKIRCLLEVKESYFYDNSKNEDFLNAYEQELIRALGLYSEPEKKMYIYHHLGKTQRRLKKIDASLNTFAEELSINPNSYAAYGQIVKVARKANLPKDKYESAIEKIKTAFQTNDPKLPLRIALSLISDLRSFKGYVTKNDISYFSTYILKASYSGMYQFYESFVSFINFFSYENPDKCLELYYKIPLLQCLSIDDINKSNYANACDALIVLYGLIEDSSDKERLKKIITEICEKNLHAGDSYGIRASLKVLNKFEQFKIVDNYLIPTSMESDPWILYWIANAKLQLGKNEALDIINLALKHDEIIGEDYLSTFYQCQGKCFLLVSDNENARIAFDNAINHCKNEKFKKSLQNLYRNVSNISMS